MKTMDASHRPKKKQEKAIFPAGVSRKRSP